jgi:DNA-binding MarR family transcriptional regulator
VPARKPVPPPAAPSIGNAEARLEQVLGYQLARATIPTTAIFMRAVGEPLGLRPVEYTILALLHEDPGLTPARLARALAVTAPNITAWLSRLEERGLLARSISPTDRRVQVLGLTAAGQRAAREGTRRLVEAEASALAGLSRGECMLLNELLRKVAAVAGLDGAPSAGSGGAS